MAQKTPPSRHPKDSEAERLLLAAEVEKAIREDGRTPHEVVREQLLRDIVRLRGMASPAESRA